MNKKILIIETDDIDFLLLSNQLCILNYQQEIIVRCFSLADALKYSPESVSIIFASNPIDNEPINITTQILYNHFAHIPLLILSKEDTIEQAALALRSGAPDFIIKGTFDAEQLLKKITYATLRNELTHKNEFEYTDYKKHFDHSIIPMWIIDLDTMHFVEVNKAAIDKYEYSKEDFLSMTILDIHPKEDMEPLLEYFDSDKSEHFDAGYWRHIKKTGEVFFVNIYYHYTELGNRQTGLSFSFDVNEKFKKSGNLLKEQKEQLDSILYSISDAIWSRNADTLELMYANNAFYKLFGFSAEEGMLDNDSFFNFIHPDDHEIFRQAMQAVRTSGSQKIEYRYYHKDGSIKILQAHLSLIKGTDGKPDTLNGTTVDVTKERALQDKIRKSEQNLLTTINNTKDLIWSVNTNLEIIFCNKPYQQSIYEIDGTIPKPGDYVLGAWGTDSFINTRKSDYERALKGESFITIVEENFGGIMLCKEFSNNPIIDHDNNIIGVNCIARDISEQKRQFLKIQEQNEKLKEIAWIQSHKVRAPVATILGLIELFNYDASVSDSYMDLVSMLKTATNNLDKIIREVVEKTEDLNK